MLYLSEAIERHIKNDSIIVRLLFAVGNGAVVCEKCPHPKFVKTTRRVIGYYIKKGKFTKEDVDVLLKSIRVCANFSLEEKGANIVMADELLIEIILKLFKLVLDERSKIRNGNELLKYIISALNNILYFSSVDFEKHANIAADLFIRVSSALSSFFSSNLRNQKKFSSNICSARFVKSENSSHQMSFV